MQQKKKNLNLKEVSKLLGVSTATVSNAFNRPDQLSEKLRERILKESSELGYFGPNLAARSLRKGSSDVVAVVLADTLSYSFSDPVASQFLQGVTEILIQHKKQLLLLSSRFTSTEQSSAESLPDGFIFYGAPEGDTYERIQRTGKPIVAVDFKPPSGVALNIDNRKAAHDAAIHAMTRGNERVAVISLRLLETDRVSRLTDEDLQLNDTEIAHLRLSGYLQAAKEKNVALPSNMIWHTPMNTPETAEIAAYEALTCNPMPNVLLCMSDVLALSAMRVAKQLDIRVPEQIKVVGFDDIPEASRSTPTLTTICQQSIEKGRIAARVLLEPDNTPVSLPDTRLVVRESSQKGRFSE